MDLIKENVQRLWCGSNDIVWLHSAKRKGVNRSIKPGGGDCHTDGTELAGFAVAFLLFLRYKTGTTTPSYIKTRNIKLV